MLNIDHGESNAHSLTGKERQSRAALRQEGEQVHLETIRNIPQQEDSLQKAGNRPVY